MFTNNISSEVGLPNSDYVIHEYFSIDLDTVWEITQKDFPDLKLKIGKILNNLS
ncbi:MAG: HepT-like ribonuclease domain-containing protein [Patescibacteria group bacterium]